jgi:hypothetical protein
MEVGVSKYALSDPPFESFNENFDWFEFGKLDSIQVPSPWYPSVTIAWSYSSSEDRFTIDLSEAENSIPKLVIVSVTTINKYSTWSCNAFRIRQLYSDAVTWP